MRKILIITFFSLLIHTCAESPAVSPGRQLAMIHCTSCHLLPEPDALTRQIWFYEILPKMGAYLGRYGSRGREFYLGTPEEQPYLTHLFPLSSRIDSLGWDTLQRYYLDNAPQVLKEEKPPPVVRKMERFTVEPVYDPDAGNDQSSTTLIQFDPNEAVIRTGGEIGNASGFRIFSADNRMIVRQFTSSVPSAFDPESGLLVEMGSMPPSDHPRGTISSYRDSVYRKQLLADSLARPVDMLRIDLDQDGSKELVLAEYGNLVGRLSTWSVSPDRTVSRRAALVETPGAIRLRSADLDGDGHEDLLALFAQGDERIEVWYSRPGKPVRQRLLRFPPSYGSSDFQVDDFDGDGDLDLIVTNGDNYDYQPEPKGYHGLRIYGNDGSANFDEVFFREIDGAYGVEVGDFDGDGDKDLAVIAYFVPPETRQFTSFLYLEQTGNLEFEATGFLKKFGQHYLRMTSGDIDSDGDRDILIANFSLYLPDGRSFGHGAGRSPVYLVLRNSSVN